MSFYTFLSYVRQGIATGIAGTYEDNLGKDVSALGANSSVDIKFNAVPVRKSGTGNIAAINDAGSGGTKNIRRLNLIGPGDIVGINKNAIVRTTPREGIYNFESNYLAAVDFYEEDFPWRYSPLSPTSRKLVNADPWVVAETDPVNSQRNRKLRPWLALIVLKGSEFVNITPALLPCIRITANMKDIFPDEYQHWAWAHVQFNMDAGGNYSTGSLNASLNTLNTELNKNPDIGISRILCPRRLEPNTHYHAFLIPAFESGRLAGLGQLTSSFNDMQKASWKTRYQTEPADALKEFPVYYSWEFGTTGKGEDFESLARKLEPKILTEAEAGKRPMNIDRPGHPHLTAAFASPFNLAPTINSYGAIRPFASGGALPTMNEWPIPAPNGDGKKEYEEKLKTLLDNTNQYPNTSPTPGPDPIIGPPMYGQWHMAISQVPLNQSQWISKVNLDPTFRSTAGLGAAVVKKNQERYMDMAWNQVGDIEKANKDIKQLQAALLVIKSIFKKNIVDSAIAGRDNPLAYAAPIVKKIKNDTGFTLFSEVEASIIPTNCLTAEYRKLARPAGPMMKRIDPVATTMVAQNVLQSFNDSSIAVATAYLRPPGLMNNIGIINPTAPASNFVITEPGIYYTITPGPDSLAAMQYRGAVMEVNNKIISTPPPEPPKPQLDWNTFINKITEKIKPDSSFLLLAQKLFVMYKQDNTVNSIQQLDIVLAAPRIAVSMAEDLAGIGPEFLMPGINKIEQNGVYLLSMNQKTVEAYLAGANDEMNRELLWREYPTDQRGTPLRHFWGTKGIMKKDENDYVESNPDYMDITDMHTWKTNAVPNALGVNISRKNASGQTVPPTNITVLAIRGELLQKYPNTVVYARKAVWDFKTLANGTVSSTIKERVPDMTNDALNLKMPIFFSQIKPDIFFVGLELSATIAKGDPDPLANNPGWFIVLEERAGEIVFGADEARSAGLNQWDNLAWTDLYENGANPKFVNILKNINLVNPIQTDSTIFWGSNSADMAFALYQKPSRVFIHAKDMLA